MITAMQLREIAKANNIQAFFQEKDYLQNIFLFNLFKKTDKMVFKGGIALKIAYGFSRFSEDLDFNSGMQPKKISQIFVQSLQGFKLLGIEPEIEKREIFANAFTAKARFKGPLYSNRMDSTNSIRLDAGKRTKMHLKPEWIQISAPYPDIPKYFALVMQKKEIFAEKVRAMYARAKPRDFFDVWALLREKEKPSKEMIEKKFKETGKSFEKAKLHFCPEKEFTQELKQLLPGKFPEFSQVKEEIIEFIKEQGG